MQNTNFKELPKTVLWQITFKCNYNCNYCISKETRNKFKFEVKDVKFFLKNIKKKLDKNWGFVLSGGEPFVHKNFFEIIEGLVKLGHWVSVITNFSADPKKIIEFLKSGGSVLASLHLEYTNPDNFLKKILTIEKSFPSLRNHLFISLVATNKILPRLEKIKKKFFEKGYQLYTRCVEIRYPERHFFPYSDKQKELVRRVSKEYNFKPFQKQSEYYGTRGLDFSKVRLKGQKCWTGCRYFCLLPNGDAFRCYPSVEGKAGYMGNILKRNFRLFEGPARCPCEVCLFTCFTDYVDYIESA